MDFRKININDKEKIEFFLTNNDLYKNYEASELNFDNIYAWCHVDDIEIAEGKNWILLKGHDGLEEYFLPPLIIDKNSLEDLSKEFRKYCDDKNIYPVIRGLNETIKDYILRECQDCFNFISYRNSEVDEYVYLSSDLINLHGKKYNVKRNHLKHFLNNYPYYIERDYSKADYEEISDVLDIWGNGKTLKIEKAAILSMLDNLERLDAFCNIIEVDKKIVAFSIGTITKNNIGIVLFEKADINYEGSYAIINQATAEKYFANLEFINRQEDMGIPNLKKSKLSYHPHHMAIKYTLVEKEIVDDLRYLYETSFPEDNDPPKYIDYYFNQKVNIHQIVYIEKERKIISALYLFSRSLQYGNVTFECPVISAAATLEEYRHQGYFRKLMQDTFTKLQMKMVPLVMLYPLDHNLYRKFGFGVMNYFLESSKKPTILEYRLANREDIPLLIEIYLESMNGKNHVIRDETYWLAFFEEIKAYSGTLEIISKNNTPIGYVVVSLDNIEELVLLEDVYLEKYSQYKQFLPTNQYLIPGNMIRIIDVEKVLDNFQYPLIEKSIRIKVIDDIIYQNNIILEITIKNEIVNINETPDYDVELNILQLGELLFTGKSDNDKLLEIFGQARTDVLDKY